MAAPFLPRSAFAEEQIANEYELKSAYIFNFLNFIDYKKGAREKNFVLCVVGKELSKYFDPMKGQPTPHGRFAVLYLTENSSTFFCDSIFIPEAYQHTISHFLNKKVKKRIFAIGETPDFARRWGVVEFYFEGRSIRFRINAERAELNGFSIRAKLLKRAEVVQDFSKKVEK